MPACYAPELSSSTTTPTIFVLCSAHAPVTLQVFVFCCAHAEQIKKYLAESKWMSPGPMKVRRPGLVGKCLYCDLVLYHSPL